MKPQALTIDGKSLLIPKLTVQQIIDMTVLQNEKERTELVQDLKDSGITGPERLEMLRDHRKESSLSATVVRSAFSMQGAYRIIACAMGGEFPEAMNGADPTVLTNVALGCLGVDLDELSESEGSSEGKGAKEEESG